MGELFRMENTTTKLDTIKLNQSLLENVAFFSDSVWAIDLETEKVLVFYDKKNPEAVGKEYTIEEVCKIIRKYRHTDETKIIERMSMEYLRSVKKTEVFDDLPFQHNENWYTLRCVYTPEFDENGKLFRIYVTNTNIQPILDQKSEIVRLQETSEILRKIERDTLTGVYNKESFMIYSKNMLEKNPNINYDMVCMEIESYRLLCERYGLEICEKFVKAMAISLLESFPKEVLLGRTDDEQFVFLLPHEDFKFHETMFNNMCRIFPHLTIIPDIKVNCGVYMNIDTTLDIPTIINYARLPIDSLRDKYGQNIAMFNADMQKVLVHEQQIKSVAREGIVKKQFQIYYQPKHDAYDETIKGAEALVRWNHPDFGFISPADFIPIFEKNGFIFRLDKYVVEAVCNDLRNMIDSKKNVVPISVNVSQIDFDQIDLPQQFERIIDQYKIPHNLIHFEVTESVNAGDARKKTLAVQSFKQKGFHIELDDFGAGYSNLSALSEVPVDFMKIDMSLIKNMLKPKYKTVLKSILMAAKGLDISAVAEGVETREQLDFLRDLCRDEVNLLIQGYYYSKPISFSDFEKYTCKCG